MLVYNDVDSERSTTTTLINFHTLRTLLVITSYRRRTDRASGAADPGRAGMNARTTHFCAAAGGQTVADPIRSGDRGKE